MKILVVEDHDISRKLMRALVELSKTATEIKEATSVAEALKLIEWADCVLLDLHLPNGHGREVVQALGAKRNDVPIIVTTAYADEAYDLPLLEVLPKPIECEKLLTALERAERVSQILHRIEQL